MRIASPAFRDGARIPARHTCDGADVAPPLVFDGLPATAQFLALVMEDPDAPRGTWTHWTWWDLPACGGIPEGANVEAMGANQGTTSARTTGWHGPCPPSGTHRYVFRLFALERKLGLPQGTPVPDVLEALQQAALEEARLVGTFAR